MIQSQNIVALVAMGTKGAIELPKLFLGSGVAGVILGDKRKCIK